MADFGYQNEALRYSREGKADWGAIWAGFFTFAAIWVIFGALGEAIFATAATATAAHPITGMSIGEGVWAVILTIIAMFVAGRVTNHFAATTDRNDRIVHGMAMFGLSVVSVIVLLVLGSGVAAVAGGTITGGVHSNYLLTVFADVGWIAFVGLILGWVAAMAGSLTGGGQVIEHQARRVDKAA